MDEKKSRVEEITEQIPEAIKSFMNGEAFQNYLATMSKFTNYSINNAILIASQRPDASQVAGFKAWENLFDRHVKKGAKGIQIIMPAPYKKKVTVDKLDALGNKVFNSKGEAIQEEVEKVIPAYKVGFVFAYEDTYGTDLPEICHRLDASVDGYDKLLEGLKAISPVPIVFEEINSGANGFFNLENKTICVKEGLPQLQTIKTTVHEMAHAMMHDKDVGTDRNTNRREREVEAEAVAFTVSSYYGLDVSEYSFGYIAGWSKDKELPELTERLEMIRSTSHEIISKLDSHLLLQEVNEKKEIIYKHGADYVRFSKTESGYEATVYDSSKIPTKEKRVEGEMKMDEAITSLCVALGLSKASLVPVNEEKMKPILKKADDDLALKLLEEKIIANPVCHIRHN